MALARIEVRVGKRGRGSAHAEYIAREGRHARLLAATPGPAAGHAEYIERGGEHAARLADGEWMEGGAHGNMPVWAQDDPRVFWMAADQHERKNGTAYREIVLSLPRELSAEQRRELVGEFVRQELRTVHPYQWVIHNKLAADGAEQPHCHLQFSERQMDGIERGPEQFFKRAAARYKDPRTGEMKEKDPASGGAKKGWGDTVNRREYLIDLRARWEQLVNHALERAQCPERVDLRSRAARGAPGAGEKKQGPCAARDPEIRALTSAHRSLRSTVEHRQADARAEREQSGALAVEIAAAEGFAPTHRAQLGAIYGAQPEQDSLGQPVAPGRVPPRRPEELPARVKVSWQGGAVRLESTDGGVVIDRGDRLTSVHGTADEAAIIAAIVAARRWRQVEAKGQDELARQRTAKALRAAGAELAPAMPLAPAPTPRQSRKVLAPAEKPKPETVLLQTRRGDERATWRQHYRARLLRGIYGDRISADDTWLREVKWIDVRSPHAGHGEACVIDTRRGSRLVDTGGEVLAGGQDARDMAASMVRMAKLKGWTEVEIGDGPAKLRQRVMAELRPLAERAGLTVYDPAAEREHAPEPSRPSAMDALRDKARQRLDAARDAAAERGDDETQQKPRGPRGPGMER